MAGTLEKLIADMRMAQGLEPDPLADELVPAATLPADIRPPELSADTSAQIDSSLQGIEPPTGSMLPEAVESAPVADSSPAGLVDPFPSPAATSQSVASSEKDSSSTIVGNRKYAQGGEPMPAGSVADITKSANPEAMASQMAIDEATQRRDSAVSLFQDQAALEAEGAMEEKQALAADDRIRVDEMARQAQFQQEAENRIAEVDMEIQDVAEREPDPSRFWSSRSAGQKALYMLTAALQAFSKPEEVPKVADVLAKFIDQDIKIQEDRLSRELAAAQGRGRSVRELITMGKEKDAAVYALRRGAVEGLAKMLDADMRQKGAPLKAQESIQRANEALGMLSAGWYKEAAAGERSNREMIWKSQEAAKERSFRASQAEKERQANAPAAETVSPNARFYADGASSIIDPRTGQQVNHIVLNKEALRPSVDWTTQYESGKRAVDDLRAYVESKVAEGRTSAWVLKHDPEFKSRFAATVRPLAQAMGYEKNISNQEGEQIATAVTAGGNLDSVKDSTFGEIAVAMQNNPEKMLGAIQRMSAGISSTYGSRMSSNADVGYYGGQRPLIYVTEPTERSRDQIVRDTFTAKGVKEDVSAQSTPRGKADAILANLPLATSDAYQSVVEVAKNTMDKPLKQQLSDIRAATENLPEGSAAKRKADRLEKLIIEYRSSGGSFGPFSAKSKKKMSALEKEVGKL